MVTWYEKAVFYHMYPLGMTGAPLENSPNTPVVHRFEELNKWVPHMKDLGCTALYIGPLFESSSHGYDTRDYRLTDRRLGDNEDFIHFVKLCHQAGIRVVVDGVFNHTGREFFAFRDIQEKREHSPYCGWYRGVNFGWDSPFHDGFSYEAWQGHYELPCLNLQNPEVKQYLFDVIRYWIDTFDIDGIRLDCANVMDFQFMKEMRAATAPMKKDFWLMGEVIHGEYSRWVNDEMLHSVTNYELHKSLYSGLNDHNFFEIAHNVRRLQNIGARDSDRALRPAISMENGQKLDCELTELIRQLGQIHTEHECFHGGQYQELLLTNRQYAFSRSSENSLTITAANSDDGESTLSIPVGVSAGQAVNLIDGTSIPFENGRLTLTLPGNSGAVLEIRED